MPVAQITTEIQVDSSKPWYAGAKKRHQSIAFLVIMFLGVSAISAGSGPAKSPSGEYRARINAEARHWVNVDVTGPIERASDTELQAVKDLACRPDGEEATAHEMVIRGASFEAAGQWGRAIVNASRAYGCDRAVVQ